MKKFTALKVGDLIGICSTGSPLNPKRYEQGLKVIHELGYRTLVPMNPSEFYGKNDFAFSNGSPESRANHLMSLFRTPEVSLIIAARGAYGSLDLLSLLDFDVIRDSGKILVGCSDVTVLLVQNAFRCGIPAIHASTLGSSFADYYQSTQAKQSVDALLNMLSNSCYEYSAECNVLKEGEGEGRILCGNLTMLTTLLGTTWDVDYSNVVLVLEEVGEAPYRVLRMLTQLKLAGKLDKLAGLVFGRFSKCESQHGLNIDEVIDYFVNNFIKDSDYPVIKGLEVGHWGLNIPMPLGSIAKVFGSRFEIRELYFS